MHAVGGSWVCTCHRVGGLVGWGLVFVCCCVDEGGMGRWALTDECHGVVLHFEDSALDTDDCFVGIRVRLPIVQPWV